MRVALVLGTRPEIVKMSPVIRACERRGVELVLIHTGQHYSYEMDRVFFEQLSLPDPHHNLDVGSGPHGAQTGKMLAGLETILQAERPDEVLVQGDTNSVLAGALAAAKLGIRVGHVEAGLRSFDRGMPEETNRIVADHVSDHLFAPTPESAALLRREGLPDARIFVTGNTVVDALLQNRELAQREKPRLAAMGLHPGRFVLMTAHRQENVDDKARFAQILEGARRVGESLGLPVVYPIHPRARKMLDAHGLRADGIRLVDPLDFLGFIAAEADARLILTDSGGVQEEACILGVPCVTLRDNTERPETLEAGGNLLAGARADAIAKAAEAMLARETRWSNPFGDGRAAERILDVLNS